MKLVIQRVKRAKVVSEDGHEASIGAGLFVLVGVGTDDSEDVAFQLAEKLYKMRLMADDKGKMNLNVEKSGGEFLVVSQFTLYADTSGGNRPSFVKASQPSLAKPLYEKFCARLEELGGKVARGSFGNYMNIEASLDGPVTIVVTSE